jgi:hypothetical protein
VSYNWSDEQLAIFDKLFEMYESKQSHILTIKARAGAAKTSSIIEAIKRLKSKYPMFKGKYLVYGSMAAEEARKKFKKTIEVSTIHSLAYHYMIKRDKMVLSQTGFTSWKFVPESYYGTSTSHLISAMNLLNSYLSSPYPYIEQYLETLPTNPSSSTIELALSLFDEMRNGNMPCSHDAYLKAFYIEIINDQIKLDPIDILIIDEVNDLSEIMYQIFMHYPARIKIGIGDDQQRIMTFLNTINLFNELPNATQLQLTKSFRVDNKIAKRIEKFCKKYLDKNFKFSGMNHTNKQIKTQAILTRTNAELLDLIIMYGSQDKKFNLSTQTKLDTMFELPLNIIYAVSGSSKFKKSYNFIKEDVEEYSSSVLLQKQFQSPYSYIAEVHKDNQNIVDTIKLIGRHGVSKIIRAYKFAKQLSNLNNADLYLLTAHTSKGQTFDKVTLTDGLNKAFANAKKQYLTNKTEQSYQNFIDETRLYYVACTRCKYTLENAIYL